ncbi:four helix bundle protein [Brevundimonas halotolerans]|uniref:Four helix bundle protein n=1 Tax=Brevundimonas halotolerans TaxID=69670 RepID=A0A7W9E8F7_9CAUL|nr:four helix bundle protein [Brevundimonas halotolerans]MBB5660700.1 four helix bundle protein [Brevundimonas halotolerans]
MGETHNHRDLKVWQISMDLVETVYRLSRDWPNHELYGLVSQARRASVSVPANIAEGAGRRSTGEFAHFVGIARGSLAEVETLLVLAGRLGYLDERTLEHLLMDIAEVGRMLTGLMHSLRDRQAR